MAVVVDSERKGVALSWDAVEDGPAEVVIAAIGDAGDVHTKAPIKNTGKGGVFYPADFEGSSEIEIRDAVTGDVVDSGTISVG